GAAGTIRPPAFVAIPSTSVTVGQTLYYSISSYASDPNIPPLPLTYSLGSDAPQGASIDPTTGLITWAVPSNQATTGYTFTVNVSDNQSPPNTGSGMVPVSVPPTTVVQLPVFGDFPHPEVIIGSTLTFDFSKYASDPNKPALPLTYTLGPGAPP